MRASTAWVAVQLLAEWRRDGDRSLIAVLDGDQKAQDVARLLGQMQPAIASCAFPAWDCLPYDRAAPAPDLMGRRMRVLRGLARATGPVLIVTTAEAALQRVPPRPALPNPVRLKVGDEIDAAALEAELASFGYVHADRVEDVGQVAIRGEVIDIFPPRLAPFRIAWSEGRVTALHRFDPVSQRSSAACETVRIDAVSEVVPFDGVAAERFPGMEHWLPTFYQNLETLFDVVPDAQITVDPQAGRRIGPFFEQIAQAYQDRLAADKHAADDPGRAVAPERLYVTADEWQALLADKTVAFPDRPPSQDIPLFCLDDKPGRALKAFLKGRDDAGRRTVFSAPRDRELATLGTDVRRLLKATPVRVEDWDALNGLEAGAPALMKLSADHGFDDATLGVTLVTSEDLIGHFARASSYRSIPLPWHMGDGEFSLGDLVIHTDHGVGVLQALETIEDGAAAGHDAVRIDYAKGVDLLMPVDEMGRLWRYGSDDSGVALDRLNAEAWAERRAKVGEEVAETAQNLVRLAKLRDETAAPEIVPPRREYEAFVAAFPFAPTPDQIHAIDDCLRDLASGRPMDRLVVGDVGFGKTEVALRAAAAAVLAGWQVALIAPTTVLARQHVRTFSRRFAKLGIKVGHLSRLVAPAEAKTVKEGLADGSVRLVVGTHALLGKGVSFSKLGLLIVDEEQRFGAADKTAIRELGSGVHALTLTATPIPRTLQSALVGLQDLSVIATPPARRRPIRTLLAPFDPVTMRTALLREKSRGGQSFVVVPRIEDLDGLQNQLETLVPELSLIAAHGRMNPTDVEEAMVGFADGAGDVLLATSIIESGLDVPRANTMIVCGAERFGLAQLHQLRGRVGRGRQQGVCYLMTAPDADLPDSARHRLTTLTRLDRLGSGLAISAQDLDLRGGGDLMGDEQAGHMRLIGLGLYQHLLQAAIRDARGEVVEDWTPEINMGEVTGRLPADYVPEVELRLNLYARIARAVDGPEIDALAEEIDDRFGPGPEPVKALLDIARLRSLARAAGVARVDAGPKAIAVTARNGFAPSSLRDLPAGFADAEAVSVKGDRLIFEVSDTDVPNRFRLVESLLQALDPGDDAEAADSQDSPPAPNAATAPAVSPATADA